MLLDYGVFKLFAFDWALEAHKGFRVVALVVAVAALLALVATKVVIRLTRDFSDSVAGAGPGEALPAHPGRPAHLGRPARRPGVGQPVRLLHRHDQEDDRRRARSRWTRSRSGRCSTGAGCGSRPACSWRSRPGCSCFPAWPSAPSPRPRRGSSSTSSATSRRSWPSATCCWRTRLGRGGRTWRWSTSRKAASCGSAGTCRRPGSGWPRTSGWWPTTRPPSGWRPMTWADLDTLGRRRRRSCHSAGAGCPVRGGLRAVPVRGGPPVHRPDPAGRRGHRARRPGEVAGRPGRAGVRRRTRRSGPIAAGQVPGPARRHRPDVAPARREGRRPVELPAGCASSRSPTRSSSPTGGPRRGWT